MKSDIRMLAMDVDGTMTDGTINISENGEVYKSFNVKDGIGIKLLIGSDIIPVIITGRRSEIVSYRAKELGITEVFQGISDKKAILENLCSKYNITPEQIAYIGDDVNDLVAMKFCGRSYSPANAVKEVRLASTIKLVSEGGKGAIRECVEHILDS